jgi:hypothetical protein
MRTWIFSSPIAQQLAIFRIDQDVIFCFIGKKNNPALAYPESFMTIVYRVAADISLTPFGIDLITLFVLTKNQVIIKTDIWHSYQTGHGDRTVTEKVAPLHVIVFKEFC